MGACLILECFVLLKWCEKQGFGPLGITGVSMGGHVSIQSALSPELSKLFPFTNFFFIILESFSTSWVAKMVERFTSLRKGS